MFAASYETLVCDRPRPGVARITLNRPQVMNAYSFVMTQELQAAVAAFRDDDALKVLLLIGAGDRAFCTGGAAGGAPDQDDDAQGPRTTLEASLVGAQMAVMIANPSADAGEGMAAFREKRPPKFHGV